MANMIVSGAGEAEWNGTYVESGTRNGKPYYSRYSEAYWGNLYIGWNGINAWALSTSSDGNPPYYRNYTDSATPDIGTWLVAPYGTAPAPTVTAEGGGATGIPLNIIMYYQRMRGN